jgi:predicted ribosomally synthesized peptide with nif11-like leader
MSVADFQAKLASDPSFADKVKGCKSAEEIIEVAKNEGITLSSADLAKALAASSFELSDEELESVSSGTVMAAALVK